MRTFADYHREKMKDPAYKKEYDALEEWFQEELAAQSRSETTPPCDAADLTDAHAACTRIE